jgi:hypothetical protein
MEVRKENHRTKQSKASGSLVESGGSEMIQSIASVMDRIEAEQATVISIGPNATSLDLLQAVYRNPSIPLPVRIRCAGLALPHEHPRLMVQAQLTEDDFATILERRIHNYERIKNGGVIEAAKIDKPEIEPSDARLAPRLADRRFRRM